MFKLIKESYASSFAWDYNNPLDTSLAINEICQKLKSETGSYPNWLFLNDEMYYAFMKDFATSIDTLNLFNIPYHHVSCIEGMIGMMACYSPLGNKVRLHEGFAGYPNMFCKVNKSVVHMLPKQFESVIHLMRK